MARYFFRFFTENNTAERHSKVFFNTDAKWLTVRGSGETIPIKHLNLDVLLTVSRRGQRNGTVASGFNITMKVPTT